MYVVTFHACTPASYHEGPFQGHTLCLGKKGRGPTPFTGSSAPSCASCRSLDFISLMTYDFHGSWERSSGHNSPLYRRQGESGAAAELNVVSGQRSEAGLPTTALLRWPLLSLEEPNRKKTQKTG